MTAHSYEPPDWIPVEYRFLGMDRRRFGLAVGVLIVALALSVGIPVVNALIPWDNPTKPGDVLNLGGATATAPVGWQLQTGSLVGKGGDPGNAVLARDGATISLRTSYFPGTADKYLDQVLRSEGVQAPAMMSTGMTSTGHTSITTPSGLVGAVEAKSGPGGEILWAAFKLAKGTPQEVAAATGLLVRVTAPTDGFMLIQSDVGALLSSLTLGAGQ